MTLDEYRRQVSSLLERDWYITWADASGEDEPLQTALADGWTPVEFVDWFSAKYDLIDFSAGWPNDHKKKWPKPS